MTTTTGPDHLDVDDVDFGLDDLVDLPERLAAMRAERPASWVKYFGQPALHLTTHELVAAAFKEERGAIPGHEIYRATQMPVLGKTVQSVTGEEHRVARALQMPFFRQRLMPGLVQPMFEPIANELIDRFADRGEAELVSEFTKQYPMKIIMRLLDLDETAGIDFARLAWEMIQFNYDRQLAVNAVAEFDTYLQPVLEERRRKPGDDLISALAMAEVDGERMTDADILAFARLMFPAASDTTFLGLGNVLTALLCDGDAMARSVGRPDDEARWIVEEGLRWNPSVSELPRLVVEDVDWRGLHIPAGTWVVLSILGANRDPAVFRDPDHFDVGRRPQNAMTFGLAAHHCLGIHLARAEMATGLRVLLDRLPNLRMQEGEPLPVVHGTIFRGPERLPVRFG
jgi:cytochrome P450